MKLVTLDVHCAMPRAPCPVAVGGQVAGSHNTVEIALGIDMVGTRFSPSITALNHCTTLNRQRCSSRPSSCSSSTLSAFLWSCFSSLE